jgi:hypothetical protein
MGYTELQAVNIILQCVGEAPIVGFSDEGQNELHQSTQARNLLHEMSVTFQSDGWSFNTMRNVAIYPNAEGKFVLPFTWLRVEFPVAGTQRQYVQRGKSVYDSLNNTYQIDADSVKADRVVEALEWDEIPTTAQYYIIHSAAHAYAMRLLNNEILIQQTQLEMNEAHKKFVREENAMMPANMLSGTGQPDRVGIVGAVPARGMRYRRGA